MTFKIDFMQQCFIVLTLEYSFADDFSTHPMCLKVGSLLPQIPGLAHAVLRHQRTFVPLITPEEEETNKSESGLRREWLLTGSRKC